MHREATTEQHRTHATTARRPSNQTDAADTRETCSREVAATSTPAVHKSNPGTAGNRDIFAASLAAQISAQLNLLRLVALPLVLTCSLRLSPMTSPRLPVLSPGVGWQPESVRRVQRSGSSVAGIASRGLPLESRIGARRRSTCVSAARSDRARGCAGAVARRGGGDPDDRRLQAGIRRDGLDAAAGQRAEGVIPRKVRQKANQQRARHGCGRRDAQTAMRIRFPTFTDRCLLLCSVHSAAQRPAELLHDLPLGAVLVLPVLLHPRQGRAGRVVVVQGRRSDRPQPGRRLRRGDRTRQVTAALHRHRAAVPHIHVLPRSARAASVPDQGAAGEGSERGARDKVRGDHASGTNTTTFCSLDPSASASPCCQSSATLRVRRLRCCP